MQLLLPSGWTLFCLALGIVLFTFIAMAWLSRLFYTNDVIVRKFNILDLELPATAQEIVILIKGIYALPDNKAPRVINALRTQLYVDFIFIPAAYGAVFILCMQLSWKMPVAGTGFFTTLAWLQVIPFCCDVIENCYLLSKIKPAPVASGPAFFKFYQWLEIAKWSIAMFAAVCALSGLLYLWLAGHYNYASLHYLLIIGIELAVFGIALLLLPQENQPQPAESNVANT